MLNSIHYSGAGHGDVFVSYVFYGLSFPKEKYQEVLEILREWEAQRP